MHRQDMDTKIHNFSLRGAALPQVTLSKINNDGIHMYVGIHVYVYALCVYNITTQLMRTFPRSDRILSVDSEPTSSKFNSSS